VNQSLMRCGPASVQIIRLVPGSEGGSRPFPDVPLLGRWNFLELLFLQMPMMLARGIGTIIGDISLYNVSDYTAMIMASFEKRVGGNARSSPSSLSNAWWNGCWGADPCQAPAAEGGGPKARLYKGQASPATIATGGPMGCSSRPCARAQRLGGHRVTHSKFNRAILAKLIFHRRSGRRCLAC